MVIFHYKNEVDMKNPRTILEKKELFNQIIDLVGDEDFELLLRRVIDKLSLRKIAKEYDLGSRGEAKEMLNEIIGKIKSAVSI